METPRIYIASLSAYNAGRLIGEWCDPTDPDEVAEVCARLPGEECAVHDYEYLPGFSGESITEACELAEWIDECESNGVPAEAAAWWAGMVGERLDPEAMREAYQGEHESLAAYVEDRERECGIEIPAHLDSYIDWEAMAHDRECSGDLRSLRVDGARTVHVFENC